jgi:predicted XRE-type DNA-binding protein
MKSAAENKPTSIVRGNIFDALGFFASEATALKIKAEILSAILEHIHDAGYTQAQLVTFPDEDQPSVSNLLKGRIASVFLKRASIEKLLRYADRLGLQTTLTIAPAKPKHRKRLTRESRVTTSTRLEQAALPA